MNFGRNWSFLFVRTLWSFEL